MEVIALLEFFVRDNGRLDSFHQIGICFRWTESRPSRYFGPELSEQFFFFSEVDGRAVDLEVRVEEKYCG